ncbi:MAG: hypothetical protein QOI40_991, partial [Alphaproteobacteria bacterium]|nr:hypothetical protein [Alphaproteobacteria bacterium]
ITCRVGKGAGDDARHNECSTVAPYPRVGGERASGRNAWAWRAKPGEGIRAFTPVFAGYA